MCLLVGDVIMDLDFGHSEALWPSWQGRADSGAVARRVTQLPHLQIIQFRAILANLCTES